VAAGEIDVAAEPHGLFAELPNTLAGAHDIVAGSQDTPAGPHNIAAAPPNDWIKNFKEE
jgi:hypothetical protein